MENTPKTFQDSSESGCFDISRSLYESTPNPDSNITPHHANVRKRKASFFEDCSSRKLMDVIEASAMSPRFSSTLNESLMDELKKVHIETEESGGMVRKDFGGDFSLTEKPYHDDKLIGSNEHGKKRFRSAPNTPEKQARSIRNATKKASTGSIVKNFSQINTQSPLHKEKYEILYPDLTPLEPSKKPLTPQKFKEKTATPAKKCLFATSHRDLFKRVFSNTIVVANIFRYLSDGDLYRLSMVSQSLRDSLALDMSAYERYRRFSQAYKYSKENYRITPPKSPPRDDSLAESSIDSKNFSYFCDIASTLNKNQSLVKCPRCRKASVVENSIAQCQDVNRCGYIFCRKCGSFADDPGQFKDKCNNARLVNAPHRSRLGDLSNSTVTSDYMTDSTSSFSFSSLNLSLSNRHDSSGFYSECESNTPLLRAKRNLSASFTSPSEVKPRALSSNNNNKSRTSTHPYKTQRRYSIVPVVPLDLPQTAEIVEPSSPPTVKSYAACSKQSKKNLKRLTR